MLDPFVKFDALIAHRTPFELRTGATLIGCLIFKTIEWENCSRDLEQFKSVRLRTLLWRPDGPCDQAERRDTGHVPAFHRRSAEEHSKLSVWRAGDIASV
jgi:hypothetical protein